MVCEIVAIDCSTLNKFYRNWIRYRRVCNFLLIHAQHRSQVCSSIRIPSAFNGLYGFRPSFNRIPYAGCANSMEGQISIYSVLGPMATSMSGVKAFLKSVLSKKPWNYDPLVIRKQWNEDEYHLSDYDGGKNLCFAVLWDDGVTMPHPPILRGLEGTKQALIRAGHKGNSSLRTWIVILKGYISD